LSFIQNKITTYVKLNALAVTKPT